MTHDCTATVAPRKIPETRSDIIHLDPLLVFQHEWISTTTPFPFYYTVMLSMRNVLLQSTIPKATTQNANLVGHLRKSNRLSIKQIQQSLAEYKFSQSTDFIYRRVPGIAWNILRKVSLQFTAIFYLHLHPYSSLAKTWFLYQTGFGPGFKFSTSHFICVLNLKILLLILSERKNLDFEGRTWKWHVAFSPSTFWSLLSRPIRR